MVYPHVALPPHGDIQPPINWFRDLDSNQDYRFQRPMCYQLHHPELVRFKRFFAMTVSTKKNALFDFFFNSF
jgi:hypothetical protein